MGSADAPGSEAQARCARAVRTRRRAGCTAKFWRGTSTDAGRSGCGPTIGGMPLADAIERIGHIPLAAVHRAPGRGVDRERYQTVYAREAGSVAAPTAGLHFTDRVLDESAGTWRRAGLVTLHVGYGTFKPVRVENVEEHEVDPEFYTVSPSTAEALTSALQNRPADHRGGHDDDARARVADGRCVRSRAAVRRQHARCSSIPGHRFRVVQGLITNFHLPRSSLLMLVAAFAGRERILAAYREAVDQVSLLQLRRRDADCVSMWSYSPQSPVLNGDLKVPAKPYDSGVPALCGGSGCAMSYRIAHAIQLRRVRSFRRPHVPPRVQTKQGARRGFRQAGRTGSSFKHGSTRCQAFSAQRTFVASCVPSSMRTRARPASSGASARM